MKPHLLVLPVLAAFLAFGCSGDGDPTTPDSPGVDSKATDDSKAGDVDTKEDRQQPGDDNEIPDQDTKVTDDDIVVKDDGVEPQGCEVDDDCDREPKQCHQFKCEDGECKEIPLENDSPCSDDNMCTLNDTCQDGECISGPAKDCADDNPCTRDTCNPATGSCAHVPTSETITCGLGECLREVPKCTNNVPNECIPGEPKVEVCDGKDNDCDGETDEDNPGGGEECDTGWEGICKAGTKICTNGKLVCTRNLEPTDEICNGLDNNCDGRIDEWDERVGKECDTGLLGVCGIGTYFCKEHSLQCLRKYDSSPEKCNGLDDDCDGETDEDNPGGGGRCETGLLGACNNGTWTCTNGEIVCAETTQPLDRDHCDGQDHDCDGEINEEGSLGCRTYFEDKDGDGWGNPSSTRCLCGNVPPAGYTTRSADCCDTDSSVNRDVRDDQWFETKNNCGDFDYDCDGHEVQELQEIGHCLQGGYGGSITCSVFEGWDQNVPECGKTGSYIHDCVNEQGSCKKRVTEKIQRCQ